MNKSTNFSIPQHVSEINYNVSYLISKRMIIIEYKNYTK